MSQLVFAVCVSPYVAPRHRKDPTVSISNDSRACRSVWPLWHQNSTPATAWYKAFWNPLELRGIKALLRPQSFVSFSSSRIQAVKEFWPRKSCTKSVTASDWGLVLVSLPQLEEGDWFHRYFMNCVLRVHPEGAVKQTMAALEAKIAFVAATRHIEEQVGRLWQEPGKNVKTWMAWIDKCIAVSWCGNVLAHGIE